MRGKNGSDLGMRSKASDIEENAAAVQGGGAQPLRTMLGRKCGHCGANAVIRKDGCDFCTACGEVGACG